MTSKNEKMVHRRQMIATVSTKRQMFAGALLLFTATLLLPAAAADSAPSVSVLRGYRYQSDEGHGGPTGYGHGHMNGHVNGHRQQQLSTVFGVLPLPLSLPTAQFLGVGGSPVVEVPQIRGGSGFGSGGNGADEYRDRVYGYGNGYGDSSSVFLPQGMAMPRATLPLAARPQPKQKRRIGYRLPNIFTRLRGDEPMFGMAQEK